MLLKIDNQEFELVLMMLSLIHLIPENVFFATADKGVGWGLGAGIAKAV